MNFFFSSALAKWGRMIGATLMQSLMMILLMIGFAIPIGIIAGIIGAVIDITSIGLPIAFVFILYLAIFFAIIVILVLTYFITFEAACTDDTVGKWISNSFAKAKRVFWRMFGWVFIVLIISALASLGAYFGQITYYISFFIISCVFGLFTAYIFYPLYQLAGERLDAKRLKDAYAIINKKALRKRVYLKSSGIDKHSAH